MALALRMHTTLLSGVVHGRKTLTEEQGSALCAYMGLSALETDYLLKLIQLDRAGSDGLRAIYRRHLTELRTLALQAKSRVPEARELSHSDRAIYYSSWHYSLVRLLSSINEYQSVESISSKLGFPSSRVREILDFLVSRGLCTEGADGRYRRTEKNTHIEASSSLVARHHQNWRARSIELLERITPLDLAFTAPVSISRKEIPKVRAILLDAISEVAKRTDALPSEEVAYLGIDWIRL